MKNSDWQPTASIESMQARARILGRIRTFFTDRNLMEVETPVISLAENTDPNINCFSLDTEQGRRFLHTSPEYSMKRLLAAGSGDIFQISKVFRKGELGRFHNPEFTLLEWYRTNWNYWQLIDEVEALLRYVVNNTVTLQTSLRLSYRQVFQKFTGVDPFRNTVDELTACARSFSLDIQQCLNRDQYLDLIMSHVVARAFPKDRLMYVFDYPASQAALATIRKDTPPVAERFEVYWGNLELANGYHELTDARDQRDRFIQEQQQRKQQGFPETLIDTRLISAFEQGMPECSGVALGLDRLLMLTTGARHIREVLTFPWDRA